MTGFVSKLDEKTYLCRIVEPFFGIYTYDFLQFSDIFFQFFPHYIELEFDKIRYHKWLGTSMYIIPHLVCKSTHFIGFNPLQWKLKTNCNFFEEFETRLRSETFIWLHDQALSIL